MQRRTRQHRGPELLVVSDLWFSTQDDFAPGDIGQCLGKGRGDTPGISWFEARDAAQHPAVWEDSLPRQRMILPQMSVGLRLRNPECEKR